MPYNFFRRKPYLWFFHIFCIIFFPNQNSYISYNHHLLQLIRIYYNFYQWRSSQYKYHMIFYPSNISNTYRTHLQKYIHNKIYIIIDLPQYIFCMKMLFYQRRNVGT